MRKELFYVLTLMLLSTYNVFGQWTMNGPQGAYIQCIYKSGTDLYIGTDAGIAKSTDEGNTWSKIAVLGNGAGISNILKNNGNLYAVTVNGLYKSPDEGGTWETLPFYDQITSIVGINNTVIISSYSGVFQSIDGGHTWNISVTGMDNTYGYYTTSLFYDQTSGLLYSGLASGLHLSTDLGNTWSLLPNSPSLVNGVLVDNNIIVTSGDYSCDISFDNGITWQSINDVPTPGITISKFNNDYYLSSNNKGLYKSTDNGQTWVNQNIPNASKLIMAISSTSNYLLIGTNGIFRQNSSNVWEEANNGLYENNISDLIVHKNTIYTLSPGGVYKSVDEGQSWVSKYSNLGLAGPKKIISDNNILYLATVKGIYKSIDDGDSWQASNNGLDTIREYDDIKMINNILYTCGNYNVYKSLDNGATWVNSSGNLISPYGTSISSIGNTIYLATMGSGVYSSVDNGSSWQSINNGLSDLYVLTIESNNNILYAGTSTGLFYSIDQGSSWTKINNSQLGAIRDITIYNNEIYVTGNRGLYKVSTGNSCFETYIIQDDYSLETSALLFFNNKVYAGVISSFGTINKGVYVNDISNLTSLYPIPVTSAIVGSATVCSLGQNYIYTVTNVPANTYAWTVPSSVATIVSGAGTNSITVNYTNITSVGTITVTETNPNSCVGQPVSLAITPTPSNSNPVITGSNSACAKTQNQQYSVPNNTGSSYAWSVPSDYTIVSGQGTNNINVTIGSSTGTISVIETTSNSCTATSAPFTVTPFTGPTLTSIGGSSLFCANGFSGENYSAVPNISGASYSWTVDNSGTVVNQLNNLVQIMLSPIQNTYTITAQATSGGCSGNIVSKTVTRKVALSAISGPTTTCMYSNGNIYSVTPGLATDNYLWTSTDGYIASGNGTEQISLSVNIAASNLLTVKKIDVTGCTAIAALTISNKSNPMSIGISGSVNLCPNQSGVVYTATNVAGGTYTWTVPANATIVSGLNTNSITVNYSGFTSTGNITVALTHPSYCRTVNASLAVNGSLNFSYSIAGQANVCTNAQYISYSVPPTTGSTYAWTVPANAYIISGQGNSNVVVSYNNFTSGNISVVETLDGGCSSNPIMLAVSSVGVSAGYSIPSVNVSCNSGTFSIQVNTAGISTGVKSFNIGISYDPNVIKFTAGTTKYVVGPVLLSAGGTSNLTSNYFSQPINATTSVLFYSVYATTGTFSGGGNVISFNFDVNPSAAIGSFTPITVNSLQEGLAAGGQTAICPTNTALVTIVSQETILSGKLVLSNTTTALGYDVANPTQYLSSTINGSTTTNCAVSTFSTLPDVLGNFTYDITNGNYINITRDIPNSTIVTGYINGSDALRVNQIAIGQVTNPTMYDMIASDVDLSGRVDGNDALFVLQRAVNGSFSQQPISPFLDWIFLDNTTLISAPFQRSTTYPLSDAGVGFALDKPLPSYSICRPVHQVSNGSCTDIPNETYRGILLGDVASPKFNNQGYSNMRSFALLGYTPIYSEGKMIIDLSKAQSTESGTYLIPVFQQAGDTAQAFDVGLDYDENLINIINVRNSSQEIIYAWNRFNNEELLISGYTMNALSEGTSVYYIEVTKNSSLEKNDWGTFTAKINGVDVNGIINTFEGQDVMTDMFVYPNPATDKVMLSIAPGEFTVEINNMKGELVHSAKNETEINVSNLAAGLYVITIKSDNNQRKFKFTKMK